MHDLGEKDKRKALPDNVLFAWWKRHQLSHGRRPILGAAIVGGAALTLAVSFGPMELAIGTLAAYATFRMLRYGVDLREALMETADVEKLAREAL